MGQGHGHGHSDEDYDWSALGEHLERNAEVHRDFLDQVMDWLRGQVDEPARILDVGSGPGVAACALAETFADAEVVAADRSPELLALARKRAARLGVRIETLEADLPEAFGELGPADLIWTSGVMHHIGDQQEALNQLGALLRPGGVVAVVEGGLPLRFLPRDIGIGRPGLQARLDVAQEDWFTAMRAGLPGSTKTVEDWPAMLARAGLMPSASRTFLVDLPAPLDTEPRRLLRDMLVRQREMLGDRIDAEDHAVIDRLVHDDDRASVLWRPDVYMLNARTVHSARRLGER
ncbi:class I SAM-dependent methyltransferase [Kutzneria sp. CA-103260]|uniref:class I SAM-dependent methyltransferase n=1 Tax=Kutzneria sp. CA-103260 TaxID=2802641 RepID=UPI001BA720E0|nr:class I SAM-dependent methyltransferase [Kutzneria sp. CA-103260]QUQ64831.1 class I SAM-dependent methyltransferase [Kutzneria sp. CA-103260]